MIWENNALERVGICDLCGSSDLHFLCQRPDGLPVSVCRNCEFSFLSKRPTKEALLAYYNRTYFQNSGTYQDYFNYAKAVTDLGYCPRIHRLSPYISDWKNKKVLEIGCAAGSTLALIKRKGGEAEGIEISEDAAGIGAEKFKLKIYNGPYEEAVIKKNDFDVILMFDVLEHLTNPGKAIDDLADSIKDNGFFALTVPNFDRFDVEGKDWPGFASWFEHLSYFKSNVLCKKLEKSGLDIIEMHTYTAGLTAKGAPENTSFRSVRGLIKKRLRLLDYPFRVARKIKFFIKGPPYLDIRRDKSGMDLFILAKKSAPSPSKEGHQ